MCISFEALALFLNLLQAPIIEATPGQIIIHAETRAAIWQVSGEAWCSEAPQIDAALRLTR